MVDGGAMLFVQTKQRATILRERKQGLGDGRLAGLHLAGPANVGLCNTVGSKHSWSRWIVEVSCQIRTDPSDSRVEGVQRVDWVDCRGKVSTLGANVRETEQGVAWKLPLDGQVVLRGIRPAVAVKRTIERRRLPIVRSRGDVGRGAYLSRRDAR